MTNKIMESANILFEMLRFEINKTEISSTIKNSISDENLLLLFKLSKRHDLAHLICDALEKSDVAINAELFKKFKNEKNVAVFRGKQIDHELKSLGDVLEEENIEFIFLKGAVIRSFYPEPWMRTSCDIDLLIKEKDIKKATKILQKKLFYKFTGKTSHDVQFQAEGGVPIELHFDLLKGDDEVSKLLEKAWDNVKETSLNQKILTDEFFYFYHIAHMATHFKLGGCGVRPFIDLYLLDKNLITDKRLLNELLEKAGLSVFEKAMLSTAKYFMEGAESDDTVKSIERYVLSAGMYGDIKNLAIINQAKKGGKKKYILSRIFLPYSKLKLRYPILEKHPVLFPFYEVIRWFALLSKKGRKKALYEYKEVKKTDTEKKGFIENLFNELKI